MAIFLKTEMSTNYFFMHLFSFLRIELERKVMEASTDGALPAAKYALHIVCFFVQNEA
jgi:hypothetical protein